MRSSIITKVTIFVFITFLFTIILAMAQQALGIDYKWLPPKKVQSGIKVTQIRPTGKGTKAASKLLSWAKKALKIREKAQ